MVHCCWSNAGSVELGLLAHNEVHPVQYSTVWYIALDLDIRDESGVMFDRAMHVHVPG